MYISHFAEKGSSSFGVRHSKRFIFTVLLVAFIATQTVLAAGPRIGQAVESPGIVGSVPGHRSPITLTAALGKAVQGAPYSGQIIAHGAIGPYQFAVISGKLPAGLTLHPTTGVITGTPAAPGSSTFTIQVLSAEKAYHADLGLVMTVAPSVTKVTVTVSPTSATVASGTAQQLTATVHGTTNTLVRWSASAGSISASGLFTAPTVSSATTTTIKATSVANPDVAASSTISVTPRAAVSVTVTPTSATVASAATQQLTAAVHGTSNTQVRWSTNAGSISASGLFTAPTVSSTTTATVTATSMATPSASASSTISVTPPATVSVTVTPTSATVASAATQQLTATVHGTSNTQVRWSTSSGSISTSGLFTAPTVSSATTATVTATSMATPSASASSAISVTPVSTPTLAVSTAALPDATQGSSYSASLAATGGSTPYSWSVLSGTLPAGVSLNSAGGLSGNTSQTGTFSFTAKVTDSSSHSASGSLTLTVDIPNTNGQFDGPAELPRVYVQSALANTPANGKTWLASDATSLNAALSASACGDTIRLQAGATFTGVFSFPAKSCDDQHWIIVRTSAPDSSLPAEGTRITPCYAGVASLPGRPALNCSTVQNVMAKLMMTGSAGSGPIAFLSGANHYRFLGLEITRPANGIFNANLIFPAAGAKGDHIILDRVWLHGTPQDDTARGLFISGLSNVAVVDSYINDFHCESNKGSCTDAQAIAGGLGSTPDGPLKIVNNFLEASTEIIIFGGGFATATPADIEIRHNHFFKPYTWMPGHAGGVLGNHGYPFMVKNHFELKNAQRVLFEGNVLENTWGGFSQAGFSVVLTPKNQSSPTHGNLCPNCQVTDVTIRYNTISHIASGFQIANAPSDTGGIAFAGERYSIHDVILDDIDAVTYNGQGDLAQVSTSPTSPLLRDVQMTHITAFPSHGLFALGNNLTPKMPNFVFSNSIVTAGTFPLWTVGGGATNCAFNPTVPTTVLNTCFTAYTFSSNALLAVPSLYPSSTWPSGNYFMANGNSVGFVNFNNGNGGDYHLTSGSSCKGAGSDGKDLGADVNAVNAAIAGAF